MKGKYPLMQLVDQSGNIVSQDDESQITEENIKKFYYHMLRLRTYDRRGKALQRQGRIGTYVPFEGQEGAQVGSALALDEKDWMFPTYRDHGAVLAFGGGTSPSITLLERTDRRSRSFINKTYTSGFSSDRYTVTSRDWGGDG